VIEIGSRRRNQPAPPHAVFEALTDYDRAAGRNWLTLLDDERPPRVLSSDWPAQVVWSSLWLKRPDAIVEFELQPGSGGTDLRWRLFAAEPVPDEALVGHLRKRLNQLIDAELRYSFGQ
jgi:hypothetical protein